MENVKIDNIIGENIDKLRENKGLSMEKMSEEIEKRGIDEGLKFSRQKVSKAIYGETSLTLHELEIICDLLDTSLENLLGLTPYRNNQERAAGEYLGFTPSTISALHANKYEHSNTVLDYLFFKQADFTKSFFHVLGSALGFYSEYKVLTTLSQEHISEFQDLLKDPCKYTEEQIESYDEEVKIRRLNIQDGIRDLIENVDPVYYMAWEQGKMYSNTHNDPNKEPVYTEEEYNHVYDRFSELEKAYKADMKKQKRRRTNAS